MIIPMNTVDTSKWTVSSDGSLANRDSSLKWIQSQESYSDIQYDGILTFTGDASTPAAAGFELFTNATHVPHADGIAVWIDYTSSVKQISVIKDGTAWFIKKIDIQKNQPMRIKLSAKNGILTVGINGKQSVFYQYADLASTMPSGKFCVTHQGGNINVKDLNCSYSDPTLSELNVGGVSVVGFRPDKLDYNYIATDSAQLPTITASSSTAGATVSIVQPTAATMKGTITVTGSNQFVKQYTVNYIPQARPADICLSTPGQSQATTVSSSVYNPLTVSVAVYNVNNLHSINPIINYDVSKLKLVSVSLGSAMGKQGKTAVLNYSKNNGTIKIAAALIGQRAITSNNALVTLKFMPLVAGDTSIKLKQGSQAINLKGNKVSLESDYVLNCQMIDNSNPAPQPQTEPQAPAAPQPQTEPQAPAAPQPQNP